MWMKRYLSLHQHIGGKYVQLHSSSVKLPISNVNINPLQFVVEGEGTKCQISG